MTSRLVLGVNIGFHDSSAALLRGGQLCHLVEQEKVSRRKYALGQTPALAVAACLKASGVAAEEVEAVAIGWDYRLLGIADHPRFRPESLATMVFGAHVPDPVPPMRWVPHHLAHAASAYYSCGLDNAAILVVDGAGESQSATIAYGHDGHISILREWPIAQSLGFLYGGAAQWAGLGEWGAGKLMGLAAYGRARAGFLGRRLPDGYELTIKVPPGDTVSGRPSRLPSLRFDPALQAATQEMFSCHFPFAQRRNEGAIAYADFAATVQHCLEEAALGLADEAQRLTGADTLVIAGGVGMNCSMVGRLLRDAPFRRIWLPPVANDVGVSLGAALLQASEDKDFAPTALSHPYWSLGLDEQDAGEAIRAVGLPMRSVAGVLPRVVAAAIASGQVVGWARGRGEIGQRALGARSLLADPRDRYSLERLNLLKGREMWRPAAPSVLAEHVDDVMATPVGDPARFMLAAGQVRQAMHQMMPATTHVDGSARPQRVEQAANPAYWAMIDQFRQLTGVPAVLNTSFNLAGDPIVNTAQEALDTFVRADGIDLLVVENLLVARGEKDLEEALNRLETNDVA
ncbi:carbamoyltransferase family protein [Catelliglobosispora koreensis]|uniref:carbamoyltransferase family protein n=1 Tax=Catelliglobosispora koreensis TaxID=129052 RepID=UPI00037C7B5C|nr:carbamoyltransferase C-terminal domain-containing protein [Catelliglobosispora koreensis]